MFDVNIYALGWSKYTLHLHHIITPPIHLHHIITPPIHLHHIITPPIHLHHIITPPIHLHHIITPPIHLHHIITPPIHLHHIIQLLPFPNFLQIVFDLYMIWKRQCDLNTLGQIYLYSNGFVWHSYTKMSDSEIQSRDST